ncbi:MAG: epoxyqueuosine reductase QueH [Faecalibacterium sp.]
MARQYTLVQRMDKTLADLRAAQQDGAKKPRLLLHACCGPCSSAVLELLAKVFEIHIYYYNPNIWPPEEYHRREAELEKFIAETHFGITVAEAEYQPSDYYTAIAGLEQEPERGNRCTVCYQMRMERAAAYAKEHGFDYFTTTLSISPHKDAARINAIGEALEAKHGIPHLTSDFKKHGGFARSLELSAEHGLYRQNYCGCEFSARR